MKTLNWHNPDNLTDEQIGTKDGWRLLLNGELSTQRGFCKDIEMWHNGHWDDTGWQGDGIGTYRVKWPLPDWAVSRKLEQPELPEGLPPLPELPTGWRWEYKGMGWKSEEPARYAVASNIDSEWVTGVKSGDIPEYGEVWGEPNQHYILAVKDKQEGWIKWSDRAPTEEDLPILCCVAGDGVAGVYLTLPALPSTHWMPIKLPPIPPRELTQEEKDEKWLSDWKLSEWGHSTKPLSHADVDAAVKAAISYARKQP